MIVCLPGATALGSGRLRTMWGELKLFHFESDPGSAAMIANQGQRQSQTDRQRVKDKHRQTDRQVDSSVMRTAYCQTVRGKKKAL